MESGKSLLILILILALGVVGYLYYQEQQRSAEITIELPKVEVQ